ncbi:hypothetical protein [Blastococcus sp. Marseille-P5729]|uniref:hypothetical protein n=1 Tax=Blastococcus sp. Marseille-P5729 TaxID=2086582 RepID=UPI00131DC8B3|nr:hypothetical protein [Blastococcus sp. Marseille-P5729]
MRMKKFAAVAMCCIPALALAGCSKPSESEVHGAVVEMLEKQGATPEQAKAYADCAAPKMVDKISRTGLNNIIEDGSTAKGTDDDVDEMSAIDQECSAEVLGGSTSS